MAESHWTRREFIEASLKTRGILTTAVAGLSGQAIPAQSGVASSHLAPQLTMWLTVNGKARTLTADVRTSILDLLREHLHLTGTKKGCNHGACGSCTVLVDGRRVLSCLVPFRVVHAADEGHAIDQAAGGARFLAGGTTLIDLMREHVEQPAALVDINPLSYRRVSVTPKGLEIGALARMADVASDPAVAAAYPAITESLLASASPQLRNMASMAGNLLQRTRCTYFRDPGMACNKRIPGSGCPAIAGENRGHAIFGGSDACVATHASDLAVALVALDGLVHVRGKKGTRSIHLENLLRLPGVTPHLEHTLRPDELIVTVEVPAAAHARRSHYLKVRDRASYEFALISAAVALDVDGGIIHGARIAAGGVGTKPWRLHHAEQAILGQHAGEQTWRMAAERATDGAHPLAHNGFKMELLKRTVFRALETVGGRT